ncbi:MAG TPA: hypothetical protein VHL53_04015, partial [Acidimicrobiia bacterium]|nr:hypothetical protein [Acidimicrobiia bacterium]
MRSGKRTVSGLAGMVLLAGVALAGPARADGPVPSAPSAPSADPAAVAATVASTPNDGLLVKFDPSVSDDRIVRAVKDAGGQLAASPGGTGYIAVSAGTAPADQVAAKLAGSPLVSDVGP